MKSTLFYVFFFFAFIPMYSQAGEVEKAQAESSQRICTAKYSALAKSDSKKAKKIEANGDKNLIVNVCLARNYNASIKCNEEFMKKGVAEVKKLGLKDSDAIDAEFKKHKPDFETCLIGANDSAMADTEKLFDLYGKGKQAEGKVLVDGWIKDGSAFVPK